MVDPGIMKKIEEHESKIEELKRQLSDLEKALAANPENEKLSIKKLRLYKEIIENFRLLQVCQGVYFRNKRHKCIKLCNEQIRYFKELISYYEKNEKKLHFSLPESYPHKLAMLIYQKIVKNKEVFLEHYEGKYEGMTDYGPLRFHVIPEIEEVCHYIYKTYGALRDIAQKKEEDGKIVTPSHFYELMGDLLIEIFLIKKEFDLQNPFLKSNNTELLQAYRLYEKSEKLSYDFGDPNTARGFSHREINFIRSFGDFFKYQEGYSTYHAAGPTQKKRVLLEKYPEEIRLRYIPNCWKDREFCVKRRMIVHDLEVENEIFVSMDYSSYNFKFYEKIKPILIQAGLRPILKRDILKSGSWTKEICCSIFECKFGIAIIDELNPNVLFEFGILVGLGRKTIVILNKNYRNTKELPSMLKDYEILVYEDANGLIDGLNNFISSFLGKDLPPFTKITLNEIEREELDKLIKKKKKSWFSRIRKK
ncbi:MAG: hypothetical protein ACTSRG_20160 [Candidatus Helarchaeota archaeon]